MQITGRTRKAHLGRSRSVTALHRMLEPLGILQAPGFMHNDVFGLPMLRSCSITDKNVIGTSLEKPDHLYGGLCWHI
jgi:hypothetical protein